MNVKHAVYALVLSAAYFVLAVYDRTLAEELTIAFVALLLIPAPIRWHHRRQRRAR